jgi:hypothetical protein
MMPGHGLDLGDKSHPGRSSSAGCKRSFVEFPVAGRRTDTLRSRSRVQPGILVDGDETAALDEGRSS